MRIAIAAVLFDDTQRIGSQRARALSREFAAMGHGVTVLTAGDPANESTPFDEVKVVRLGPYRHDAWPTGGIQGAARNALVAAAISGTFGPLHRLNRKRRKGSFSIEDEAAFDELNHRRLATVRRVDSLLANRVWTKQATRRLRDDPELDAPFDVVFSTFEPLGRAVRDSGLARAWVADFRDPATAAAFLAPLSHYLRNYQTAVLRDADAITTISQGCKRSLLRGRIATRFSDKITVVTNGFTAREHFLASKSTQPGPLVIAYAGAIYGSRLQSIGHLLEIMAEAHRDGARIELHYAGKHGARLREEAARVGADHLVHDLGLVSFAESLALQDSADALLVSSWNTAEESGVLSGKFFEYLGADRPIIAMVSGDVPNAEITKMVRDLELGVSWEEANAEADDEGLRAWLNNAATARAQGQGVAFTPRKDLVGQFDYRQIAQRLVTIFHSLENKNGRKTSAT